MAITWILLFMGVVVLIFLWTKRHKKYISSYNFRFPLGRIKDQAGFDRWSEITGYTFAFLAILLAVISMFFPEYEITFFVLMHVLIFGLLIIYMIGSYRFLR